MNLKDKKIAVYKAIYVNKDKEGFSKKRWQAVHAGSLWAYTRQLSAKEFFAAQAQQFQEERLFVINWRSDIAPGMVVKYRDNWYEIIRVDPLEDYKVDVKLYVKQAVGGYRPQKDEVNCTPNVRQYDILKNNWGDFMPKGMPNKRYTAEFKKHVIETMKAEKLSYRETARRFDVNDHHRIQDWERIYLTYGVEGFSLKRRSRGGK